MTIINSNTFSCTCLYKLFSRGLSFSEGSYQITGSQSNIYQAAQTSYNRMSPSDDFRPSGSDNISYSGLGPDSGQLIAGVVDSSTLQQVDPSLNFIPLTKKFCNVT